MAVRQPKKVGPKLLIYDVPSKITDEIIMRELYEKNIKDYISLEEFERETRIVSRTGKTKEEGNVIVELPESGCI